MLTRDLFRRSLGTPLCVTGYEIDRPLGHFMWRHHCRIAPPIDDHDSNARTADDFDAPGKSPIRIRNERKGGQNEKVFLITTGRFQFRQVTDAIERLDLFTIVDVVSDFAPVLAKVQVINSVYSSAMDNEPKKRELRRHDTRRPAGRLIR